MKTILRYLMSLLSFISAIWILFTSKEFDQKSIFAMIFFMLSILFIDKEDKNE